MKITRKMKRAIKPGLQAAGRPVMGKREVDPDYVSTKKSKSSMQFSIEVGELVTIRQFGHKNTNLFRVGVKNQVAAGAKQIKANKTGIVISHQKRQLLRAHAKEEVYEVLTNDGVIVRVPGTRLRKAD